MTLCVVALNVVFALSLHAADVTIEKPYFRWLFNGFGFHGLRVSDGRLSWAETDDPMHCYYRVYMDGKQIASTVATSLPVKADDVSRFAVKSVDKWNNGGK